MASLKEAAMRKTIYFDRFRGDQWPPPNLLEPFFLAPKGQEWSYRGGNDSWGLEVQGLLGTDHLPPIDRVNVTLSMFGNPDLGALLLYDKWDGRIRRHHMFSSKGDLSRIRELVRSLHGTPLPVGLFVPFRVAWEAVKEFMETNGELPTSIGWVENQDLPPQTFPDP
jgi:hypothetical protein